MLSNLRQSAAGWQPTLLLGMALRNLKQQQRPSKAVLGVGVSATVLYLVKRYHDADMKRHASLLQDLKALEKEMPLLEKAVRDAEEAMREEARRGPVPLDSDKEERLQEAKLDAANAAKILRRLKRRAAAPHGWRGLIEQVKIVDVVRFTATLIWDLTHADRLRKSKDPVNRLLGLVWPRFIGGTPEQQRGRGRIIGLFLLGVAKTLLLHKSSQAILKLAGAAFRSRKGSAAGGGASSQAFKDVAKSALLLVLCSSATNSLFNLFKDQLAILWRGKITNAIQDKYYNTMNYYHINNLPDEQAITDAEERITREVASVSQRLINLIGYLATSIPPIVWFTYQLYKWRGLKTAMIPHVYLLLAYEFAQRLFPKNIGILARIKAGAQASYHKAATRVQVHGEAIAALSGAEREKEILQDEFKSVEGSLGNLQLADHFFNLVFKVAYTYGCRSWISSFIMYPFLKSRKPANVASELAQVRYTTHLMTEMLVANGQVLNLHANARHMWLLCRRITSFMDALEGLESYAKKSKSDVMVEAEDYIAFEDVQIYTPTGVHLVEKLNFRLERGESLLLTGHNGAGKSSLFRTMGGLWAVPEGGRIHKPGVASEGLHTAIFYLPQKPYNVLGTLQDQLTYPQDPKEVKLSRRRLRNLLQLTDLLHLLEGSGVGDPTKDIVNWEDRLSLGEQQRLAIARLFYHNPKFAILDECTSAVSREMEEQLYRQCQLRGITYLTICHRPALKAFHQMNLHLVGGGTRQWELKPIDHSDTPLYVVDRSKVPPPNEDGDYEVTDPDADLEDQEGQQAGDGSSVLRRTQLVTQYLQERSAKYDYMRKVKELPRRGQISRLLRLMQIFLPGSYGKLAALIGSIGLRTLCHEGYSYIIGKLFGAMVERDTAAFLKFGLLNVAQDMATAFVEQGTLYLQDQVASQWTHNLTNHLLDQWFKGNAYYNLRNLDRRITDPDQRITEEVQELSSRFGAIWKHAIAPSVDMVWFSWRLWRLIGFKGMSPLLLYMAGCWTVLKMVIPDHEKVNAEEKQLEGRFRFVHTRLRNHAESVAFFGGGARERQIAEGIFEELTRHMHKARAADARYQFVFQGINKDFDDPSSPINLPEILTSYLQLRHNAVEAPDLNPSPVSSSSSSSSRSAVSVEEESPLASDSFYIQSAANHTLMAFGRLLYLFEHLSNMMSSSKRLCEMIDVLDDLHAHQSQEDAIRTASGPVESARIAGTESRSTQSEISMAFQNADIVTPNGICLAEDVSVTVPRGRSLLITGPNSVGKTSVFRVLAGLWPVPNPEGRIVRPPGNVFLVPQKAYSVRGSFQDQLTYPLRLPKRDKVLEERLLWALEQTGLSHLLDRYTKQARKAAKAKFLAATVQKQKKRPQQSLAAAVNALPKALQHSPSYRNLDQDTRTEMERKLEGVSGWDVVRRWEDTLSLGEQQRMGLARLFFHRTAFAVLDECTDAVSMDVEAKLYESLHRLGITCVTISKRLALTEFHTQELRLGIASRKGWEVRPIPAAPAEQVSSSSSAAV